MFSDMYLLLSAADFLIMFDPAQHGFCNLSPIAFQARSRVYAYRSVFIEPCPAMSSRVTIC
jgi:hypothetical protein